MLDREQARRDTRRFQSRLRAANLRHSDACMEDVDYRTSRGLDRALFQSLGGTEWIDRHRSVLITGPCGVGKSWLACALGHAASRADRTVLYHRLPRLFAELELARGDGRFDRLFRKIARVDLLILDDWGPERLTAPQRRDLMEIVEERYGRRSTIVTSQLPVETWHEVIGEPTFADAPAAIGEIANRGGERALEWLDRAATPAAWSERTVRWTVPTLEERDRAVLLSKLQIQGSPGSATPRALPASATSARAPTTILQWSRLSRRSTTP